jgi:hypothetical protein
MHPRPHIDCIAGTPKTKQRFVIKMIDTVLAQQDR